MNKKMATAISCLTFLAVTSTACSSPKDSSNGTFNDANVETATQICNDTLKQAGKEQDFEAMLKRDTENADVAAELAQKDDKWSDLASAISNVAAVEKEVQGAVDAMMKDDTGVGVQRAQEVLDDLTEAKRDVIAQCRQVKASGGKVSQDLMDKYIK